MAFQGVLDVNVGLRAPYRTPNNTKWDSTFSVVGTVSLLRVSLLIVVGSVSRCGVPAPGAFMTRRS